MSPTRCNTPQDDAINSDERYLIDLQIACPDELPVSPDVLYSWIITALSDEMETAELTLRLVSMEEITFLNKTYRKQDKPTNVLAFPGNIPEMVELSHFFLGDIIVCPAVLEIEAKEQNKSLEAHFSHIIIHGVLHLLGYDHMEDEDTKLMQGMEIKLLDRLGFSNPYGMEEQHGE